MSPGEPRLTARDRILYTIATYSGAMGIYYAAGHSARPPFVSVATALDDALPFVPLAMYGYALAYVVPLSLVWLEREARGMRRLARSVLLAYAICAPFWVAMPVADADPPIDPLRGVEERMLQTNRQLDTTKNAFPSMHVGLAVLLALVGWRRSRAWGLGLGAAAVVISVSTLFVKQHFVLDVPAGALVGWFAFRIVHRAPVEQDAPVTAARGSRSRSAAGAP